MNGRWASKLLLALALGGCVPPRPAPLPAPGAAALEEANGVRRFGSSWVGRTPEGLLVERVTGSDYGTGFALGRLGAPEIRAQEEHLNRLFTALVPSGLFRFWIRQISAFRLRRLHRQIPDGLLLSIAGLADGYAPTAMRSSWSPWRRILSMHALYDLSQRFVDAPALASACTGFLSQGPGPVLLARNFDFEGGEIFDRNKVVLVVAPERRIPWLSITFPGMLGVVTGLNREGIGVALQAIVGGETASSGTPMTLLLADVLGSESTFDGAVERIRRARVFVSGLIFLADGKSGRIGIVEKSPTAFALREGKAGRMGATNQAESPAVTATERRVPPGSTSRRRRVRLDELLKEHTGPLTVADAVAILRDRRGASGVPLGPGNRNAIDALIAEHSAVLDLTARRAWVSVGPRTLGAYVPVDLEAVLASAEGPPAAASTPLPADPWLADGSWKGYREARAALMSVRRIERERSAGWVGRAVAEAERAHRLAPDFAEAAAKLGELEARSGNRQKALALLDQALALDPAPAPYRVAVENLRNAVAAGKPLSARPLSGVLQPDEMIEESR